MYILSSERHYLDGKTATVYFKAFCLGFAECTMHSDEAKQFRTKKDAVSVARQTGRKWEVTKA